MNLEQQLLAEIHHVVDERLYPQIEDQIHANATYVASMVSCHGLANFYIWYFKQIDDETRRIHEFTPEHTISHVQEYRLALHSLFLGVDRMVQRGAIRS